MRYERAPGHSQSHDFAEMNAPRDGWTYRHFTRSRHVHHRVLIVGFLVTQLPQQSRSIHDPHPPDVGTPLVGDAANRLRQELERRLEQRVNALERLTDAKLANLSTLIDAHAERVVLALAAADKAVSKAEAATEKRFESVNEFRQTLSDQTRSFISKVEFEAVRDTNAARLADLASRMDKTEGKAVGFNAGWVYLLGGLSVAATLVTLVILIVQQAK
jgi:predicted transcriptional regulator